ncbi:MAG: 50S ribosomal protein L4 [DPANN group archaeon]|nr:50S ribosomal protein L4 [DPANN group archaeon]
MKLDIFDPRNEQKGSLELPPQFDEPVRKDLIKKAVESIQSTNRQPYGASPEAGKRASSILSKRRRAYRGSYGLGISRTPRKIFSRRGTRMNWAGAFSPNTVGGRRAHPPKAIKNWKREINRKERRKAIRSALAASLEKTLVLERGHQLPEAYPFLIDDSFQDIGKTKEVITALKTLGFGDELQRTSTRKIRAGKGKMRGRKYRQKTGVLFVVDDACKLYDAAQNIPGVEIMFASDLNAEVLAPGGVPGRMTLYTSAAIQKINTERLYTDHPLQHGKKERSQEENGKTVKEKGKARATPKMTVKDTPQKQSTTKKAAQEEATGSAKEAST